MSGSKPTLLRVEEGGRREGESEARSVRVYLHPTIERERSGVPLAYNGTCGPLLPGVPRDATSNNAGPRVAGI